MDWAEVFRLFCQPKPMAGNLSVNDFLNLTIPQVMILLQPCKDSEAETEGLPPDKVYSNIQEWRRDNVDPNTVAFQERYPTDEDKRVFYGIWPFSESVS